SGSQRSIANCSIGLWCAPPATSRVPLPVVLVVPHRRRRALQRLGLRLQPPGRAEHVEHPRRDPEQQEHQQEPRSRAELSIPHPADDPAGRHPHHQLDGDTEAYSDRRTPGLRVLLWHLASLCLLEPPPKRGRAAPKVLPILRADLAAAVVLPD